MIARIENGTVVETAHLPVAKGDALYTTREALVAGAGEDWREDATEIVYDARHQMLGDYVVPASGPVYRPIIDRPPADVEKECLDRIDVAAGEARSRLVSPGELVLEEYRLAAIDAKAYKAAGYTGTVPGGVSSWAAAKGWSNQQAADDIIATEAQWVGASNYIRTKRLDCKERVRRETTGAGKVSVATEGAALLDTVAR